MLHKFLFNNGTKLSVGVKFAITMTTNIRLKNLIEVPASKSIQILMCCIQCTKQADKDLSWESICMVADTSCGLWHTISVALNIMRNACTYLYIRIASLFSFGYFSYPRIWIPIFKMHTRTELQDLSAPLNSIFLKRRIYLQSREISFLTLICLVEFSILINWTSPLPISEVSDILRLFLFFLYSILNGNSYKQTVQILISAVCMGPINETLSTDG